MRELSKWLQTNPAVVIAMFLISLTSGLAGLVLGWEQLYRDYLSKSIQLPVWLLLLAALLLPTAIALARRLGQGVSQIELASIAGKKFGVQQLTLDGKAFERCEFHGTELLFSGERPFSLNHCSLYGGRLSFTGAAAVALVMLTKLYSDPGMRAMVDGVLANIKAGSHPASVPPAAPN